MRTRSCASDTVEQADAWGHQTFIDHFSGVPGLTESPVVCRPEPGRAGGG